VAQGFAERRGTLRRHVSVVVVLATLLASCGSAATPAPTAAPTAAPPSTPASTPGAATEAPTPAKPAPATLEVWLGGILTTATPGSDARKWVDDQVARFKEANPGSDVNISLLPPNNDQLAAQVQAAFAANNVPDVMMLYSGSYTLAYQSGLMPLNSFVDATPGFYDSMSLWELSCQDYDCKGGQGTIYGVPSDAYSFLLYYNQDLLTKAGIAGPPATYDELYQDCAKLDAQGIVPFVYGDQDGYTTVNLLVDNILSYWEPGDVQAFEQGTLKFTDPKWVEALKPIVAMRTSNCVNKDASTLEQLHSADLFTSEKGAMFEGQPQFLPYFKPIYDKVSVAKLPRSGNGPLNAGVIGSSGDDWVIPAAAKNPELAWELIKTFSDQAAGASMIDDLGSPPCNVAAQGGIADPHVQAAFDLIKTATLPEMDIVMSQATALFLYKHLQLAFAGQETPDQAMQAVQQYVDQQGGKP
jgi:ABC-type glycerol-3-phosphate transport system substrate-binding protein